MNKLLQKVAKIFLGLSMAAGVGVAIGSNRETSKVDAANGEEITSVSNIVSGTKYYIKGVRGGTTYYLSFTDAIGSQSGTETSSTSSAQALTFTAVTGGYHITTSSGKYIAPGTSNGKINVSNDAIVVSASNQNSKIRLSIVSGTTTWSIQKNTSAANFGGYKNTQADITLIDATPAKTLSSISLSGATTSFVVGDTFSFGGTVTAHYSDNSTANVTSSTNFSGYNMSTAGNYTVTASYTEGTTKTATYSITVSAPVDPTSVTITGTAVASQNGDWDFSGLTVTDSGSLGDITSNCVLTSSASTATAGTTSITVHVNYRSGQWETNVTNVSAKINKVTLVTDTFDVDDFAATGTSYTAFSINGSSGATYVGYSAKPGSPNSGYIQFNDYSSSKNRSIATSVSAGYIRSVSVTWGNASSKYFTVYVGDSAYSNSSTGASGTAQATTLTSSTTTVNISGNHTHVSLYPSGAIYPASVSFTWQVPNKYSVSYDANNNDYTGAVPSATTQATAGSSVTLASALSCSGYNWLGWNTSSSGGSATRLGAGSSYKPTDDITLYGEWEVSTTPTVSVSPANVSGYRGQTQTLTVAPLYFTAEKYVWRTSDTSVVKINSSEQSTVETTGTTVTIEYQGDSAASAIVYVKGVNETQSIVTDEVECTVSVTASSHSLTLSPSTAQTVEVGSSVSITATSNATGAYSSVNVTATSSDSTLVQVDGGTSATKASGSSFSLSGVAQGTTSVVFTTTNGDSSTLSITVIPAEKNTITGKYQLCTSTDDLVENGHYIIGTATEGSAAFMGTEERDNNRTTVSGTVSNSLIQVETAASGESIMVVRLNKSGNYWTMMTKNYSGTDGYLASVSYNNNQLKVISSVTDNAKFDISFSSNVATIHAQSGVNTYIRYNATNTPPLISCYNTSSSQSAVYLYKQIDEVPISTISIPTTYGASAPLLYEGQSYTFVPTYNEGSTAPTTPTSELSIVSGGTYIEVSGLTVSAKVGAITSGTTATAQVKAIATDGSGTESNTCTITITKAEVIGVEVIQDPTKTSYVEGQTLDLTGMVTTLTWNYGGTTTLEGAISGISTSPSLATQLTVNDHNGIEVSVTYAGVTSEEGDGFVIEVVAKAVTSIKSWTDLTTSYPIDSTLEADGSIVVEYNDGTESEPLSVASLWANSEVTFKLGDVTVTPGTTTLSSSDNGKNLTIIYSGHQKSVAISVKNVSYQFLTRIESTDGLVAGETYIIAARHAGKTYVMTSEVVSKPAAVEWSESWSDTYKVDSTNFTVDSLRADVNTWGWTLGGSSGNWTFTGTDGKSLSYSSSTNFNSTGTNTWTISTSGITNSGYWKIANTGNTDRVITFREGSTMAFAPYANSNPQGNTDGTGEYHYVEIYRVLDVANTSLDNWNNTLDYFDYLTCSDAGSYEFDTGKSWSNMASSFADLDIEVRAYFKHASYSYDGSDTTATYGTDSDVAEFVCRYDYIVDKYGWTDFIGRDGTTYDLFNSSGAKPLMLLNIKNTNTVAIIVIISMVSVTAIGGYFFLKKRKED